MKKLIVVGIFLFLGLPVFSQVGLGFGPSYFIPFGGGKNFTGVHFNVEIPIDDESSYYGRLAVYAKRLGDSRSDQYFADAIDPSTTFPYTISIESANQLRFTNLHLGRRFYFLESYDYGFGLYGSTELMASIANSKVNLSDYDESKYRLVNVFEEKGSFFGVAFGFNGGAKYSFPFGTAYFDLGFNYLIFGDVTNTQAQNTFTEMGSNLLFSFNLGFRKDLF